MGKSGASGDPDRGAIRPVLAAACKAV